MTKFYALLHPRPDLSLANFHGHWSSVHAQHALHIKRLRRYVQSHRIDVGLRDLESAPYEGVAELWFDDIESALGLESDPDYTQYAKLDEPNFLDISNVRIVICEEREISQTVDQRSQATGVKAILILKRTQASTLEELERKVLGLGDLDRLTDGHHWKLAVVATADRNIPSQGADVICELWWPSIEIVKETWPADRAQLLSVFTGVDMCSLVVEERRIIWPGSVRPDTVGE